MLKIILILVISIIYGFASNSLLVKIPVNYKMDYTKDTYGLVRNIKVYKNPKWISKVELESGKKAFFVSPKSMFEFYFRPGKWFDMGVKREKDFKHIIVTDYITMKAIDAKDAYYVYGSREISPAGDDLVSFKSKEEANKFAKKYNGKRVFTFDEISDALIRLLNGRI